MLRSESIQKYEIEVRTAFQELFDVCRKNMNHARDILLCQLNGFYDYYGHPCVGLGEEGLNCLQQINSISFAGIGEVTDDDSYFEKHGRGFLKDFDEIENQLYKEKANYLNVWENTYFF